MNGRAWTDRECNILRRLAHAGYSARKIALWVGHARSSVLGKASALGIRLHGRSDAMKGNTNSPGNPNFGAQVWFVTCKLCPWRGPASSLYRHNVAYHIPHRHTKHSSYVKVD